MDALFFTAYFIFGLLIGSSLNVVVLRYHNKSFFKGRSRCFMCNEILRWYELVPLFSFLAQKGRCRSCKSKISWQYFLVELSTGLLFGLAYLKGFEGIQMPIVLSILSILVAILVYDLHHKIIPDGLVALFIGLAFVSMFFNGDSEFVLPSLSHLFAGPVLFTPFFALWFYSKGIWMGLGDGKLALGIGWYLGLSLGVSAIIFAFWIGAVVSLVLLGAAQLLRERKFFRRRHLSLKSEIPFAPFIIAGFLLVVYFELNLIHFIL